MAHRIASHIKSPTEGAKSKGRIHQARVSPEAIWTKSQSSPPSEVNQERPGIFRTLFHRERAATISRQLRIQSHGYATLHHAEISVISNRSPNSVIRIRA